MSIDKQDWDRELRLHAELFRQLAYHLPRELLETKGPDRETPGDLGPRSLASALARGRFSKTA